MAKRSSRDSGRRGQTVMAIIGVLVLVMSGLAAFIQPTPVADPAAIPSATPAALPTVPEGGTVLSLAETYVHSSGLLTIPRPAGWDLPGQAPEEEVFLAQTRVGVTFINSPTLSVIHAYAERDTETPVNVLEDFNTLYTPENLEAAWTNFDTWRETSRGVQNDAYVIEFDLTFNGLSYYGRQISRLENGWQKVLRLVTPGNNYALLDAMQQFLEAGYRIWTDSMNTPPEWRAVADTAYGFMQRYPLTFQVRENVPGIPYVVAGQVNNANVTVISQLSFDPPVLDEAAARAWVEAELPGAQILTVQPEVRNNADGYTVAFTRPDRDGNALSYTALLLNASGAFYVQTVQSSRLNTDLLTDDPTGGYKQLRDAFLIIR
jgi:hypothetical protein